MSSTSSLFANASDNRFAPYTPKNHSAPIWISSILCPIFALIILGVRLLFVKLHAHGLDDVILTLAHIVGLGMWGALYSSLDHGLGQSLEQRDPLEISQMRKSFYSSRVVFYLALGLSKCSALVFVRNIYRHISSVILIAKVTLVVVIVWSFVAIFATSFGCSSEQIIPDQGKDYCVTYIAWLRAISICDAVTEAVIMLLPILPLYKLMMPLKRRVVVIIAFSSRIPTVFVAIMHLLAYTKFIARGQASVDIAPTAVSQSALLALNLMSATVPALKGFVQGFATNGVSYSRGDLTMGKSNKFKMKLLSIVQTEREIAPREEERRNGTEQGGSESVVSYGSRRGIMNT